MKRTAKPARLVRMKEHVLVVLASDGWVEVYGRKNVLVQVVNRVHACGDAETANDLDRLVEASVSRNHRRMYYPNKLRATGQVAKVLPEDRLATLEDLALLRAVQKGVRP